MSNLSLQRCFNHARREAAARCPECVRHYCRECITEHDERVICAACLAKLTPVSSIRRGRLVPLFRFVQLLGGLFVLWLFFYGLGQILLTVPGSFHDGTIWKANWIDEE